MTFRFATATDIPLLAAANAQLLEDERHERRLSHEKLIERWKEWIPGDYRAVLFENSGESDPIAYALFRPSESGSTCVSFSCGGIAGAKVLVASPFLCFWMKYGRAEPGCNSTSSTQTNARWVSGGRSVFETTQ
jgi:hypothetical protein